MTAPIERLVRLNATEHLRIAVLPTPRGGPAVVRLSMRVRRIDGVDVDTPAFTLERQDLRPLAQALAALARELDGGT
jgi:hypothetical protein